MRISTLLISKEYNHYHFSCRFYMLNSFLSFFGLKIGNVDHNEKQMNIISPGSFIKQQIEFDCPICSETYDDEQRFPMMLCSSQHSCCLSCVNNVLFKKNQQQGECPFCKAKIRKKEVKKFRLLHEIKETANKLKANSANVAEAVKSVQELQEELSREREKNAWLIQHMRERQDMWIRKLKADSQEEERLKTQLLMRKFELEHLRALVHDQNERLSLQRVKENSLLSENIKMKLLKQEHAHQHHPRFTFEDFEIIQKLGKGDYSIVYLVREKRIGFLCALKAIEKWKVKQLALEETVIAEIKATSYIDHPNITKVYGYFWDQKFVYTIGEYAVEESLAKYIKKHPKANFSSVVRQVALAVQQLATHSIVHNEINCDDVILTFKDVVKLSGFSWVNFVRKGSNDQEGFFKDIRAIAPICYQIMHPQKAFKDTKSSIVRKEMEEEIKKPEGDPAILSFIELVLSKSDDPFRLLNDILNHPYLNDK